MVPRILFRALGDTPGPFGIYILRYTYSRFFTVMNDRCTNMNPCIRVQLNKRAVLPPADDKPTLRSNVSTRKSDFGCDLFA